MCHEVPSPCLLDRLWAGSAGEKMHLEGILTPVAGTDVGGSRWSNDGSQTLGLSDISDLMSSLMQAGPANADHAQPMSP